HMRITGRLSLTLAALAIPTLLLTACDGGGKATGSATATASGESSAAPSSTSSKPAVNRPKQLDMAKVDPCAVMNKLPLSDYGFSADGSPPKPDNFPLFPGTKSCGISQYEANAI